ncbi:UDP-N-acetylglucosamine--N-acetylmuramyl-(pentapeptide) pyrophosphoryl-undecaprenol N-acetylglucosamine transferase [Pseudochelatococcus lubricantis]|uniref:UDP-N-acetylglucosamine--N-acetylmuramyl-(pentapeptide) pyrophosphoryl-undecaprenol N-acetylglucosamine transferase n=1 Tax=Pseudochelatococcus lubricantis TaxID=1538102 RepID=A0ABX0V2Z3_9HYPH|nr:undecaprenyldiphospho-muramoylpentapeptide beta-N-acetylglucosaminyltransferase [Pseudochelatococcus lubricantis]NIJ59582.1 UDP-N-acetylglucosamine--N-acetylmuramyl-(pentapeptide) pyrophosphoryl-undecaprenol N-acetylglucosamine transferase [Pseudochelatococcus lubricantis]
MVDTQNAPLVIVAAGGTGGHLFPAEALTVALKARGARVELATDTRAAKFAGSFPADAIIEFPAATPSGRSPLTALKAVVTLARGFLAARGAIRARRPAVVVGFGGYPTVPPLLAAASLRVPVIVHEQNAVLGRANLMLSRFATLIATGFPGVGKVPEGARGRVAHVGNPVRPAVREAAAVPFRPLDAAGTLSLVVTGGSQGARVMSDIVPPAVEQLPENLRRRLSIVQQARAEDVERVRETYARLGVAAEIAPFFTDLPRRMAEAHLVIGRAGASTVAELAVIGRASILVPLPGSLDQDQAANAAVLVHAGAASAVAQKDFTPDWLARELAARFDDPASLQRAAEAARTAGYPDAAERLADRVLRVARGEKITETAAG